MNEQVLTCSGCGGHDFGAAAHMVLDERGLILGPDGWAVGDRPEMMWCRNDGCTYGYEEFDPTVHPNPLDDRG